MSIALLTEVYEETRRLAIAGSGMAVGDFRLKKFMAPLEKAGAKAPVFSKVAEAIENVVDGNEKSASASLLELSTLMTAVLYTQGKTGAAGELTPIETSGFTIPTAASTARVLKPLIEALTTTGSGRVEIIKDAHQRGAFRDLRLVKPTLAAIDDVYGEIGDFVANEVLPIYGKAILPRLRASFDVRGKKGHVRRLLLMHRLDPEATRDLVETALESGSKEMKVAAISCLKDSKGHLSYVLEQTRAKAKDVRQAAFRAIARFTETEVVDSLIKALAGSDVELAAGPVSENRSPKLLDYLLTEARRQLEQLLTLKDAAKLKKAINGFYHLLGGFVARDDPQSVQFLIDCFGQRDAIGKLKGTPLDGFAINVRIASLMARSNSQPAQQTLIDAHETLPPAGLRWAFVAAMRTRTPQQLHQLFSPYYMVAIPKKRGRNPAKDKQETIRDVLCRMACGHGDWYRGVALDDPSAEDFGFSESMTGVELDPAWLDDAVRATDLRTVCALATPTHAGAATLLMTTLDDLLAKSGDTADHDISLYLQTLINIGHPQAVDYFLRALEKAGKRKSRYYYGWWLMRLIPDLPRAAVPKIEALLPQLSEKIVEAVFPYLEALKAK